MLEIVAFLSLLAAVITLISLSYIDLRIHILPNIGVAAFAVLGFIFHLSTLLSYATLPDMALGAVIGGGLLYLIRETANRIYKEDTLGLGDVKLLGAAGIWLGPENILIAVTLGAMAGFLHGFGLAAYKSIKTRAPLALKNLSLPAGPGFALGIFITGLYTFWDMTKGITP